MYLIKDLLDEEVKGTFYTQELQRVWLKKDYAVEKVWGKVNRILQNIEVIPKYVISGSPLLICFPYK